MDTKALALLLSAGLLCACRQQEPVQKFFLKKLRAVETSGPFIWPGFSSAKVPAIVRFGREGALLIGSTRPVCGFTPVGGNPANAFFRGGAFEPWMQVDFAHSLQSCAGEVYFSDYKPERDLAFQDAMFHEYFHSYQKRYFKWPYYEQGRPRSISPEQAAAAYIEQILLAKALLGGPEWKKYAGAFTAMRLYKKRLPDPYAFNPWEARQEAVEGTARYFEIRAKRFDSKTGSFLSPPCAHLAGMLLAQPFDSWFLIQARQYATGAAQGLLMDRAGVDWKKAVEDGSPVFSVFSASFPSGTADGSSVESLKSEYDYAGLAAAAKRYVMRTETRYPVDQYGGKIVLKTCGKPSINLRPFMQAPSRYRLENGKTARPFELLELKSEGSFSLTVSRGGALSISEEPGANCLSAEILTTYNLPSTMSIDKTGCAPESGYFVCKRLSLYDYFMEGHFRTPVKLTKSSDTLILEIQ